MALMKCPECWNNVSSNADKCPNCGAKIKEMKKTKEEIFTIVITICTFLTTLISIYIAKQSLDISERAFEVSQVALKSTSPNTEPILDINVDWDNDKISVKHETFDMYQIQNVEYGAVRTIAIANKDASKISSIEIHEKNIELDLEKVDAMRKIIEDYAKQHAVSKEDIKRYNISDADMEQYNKEFELNLKDSWMDNNTDFLDMVRNKVVKECDKHKNIIYWEDSSYFDYCYIEIIYSDVYNNIKKQYYIYKKEYSTTWRLYKLTKEQYQKYTKNVKYGYNSQWSKKRSEYSYLLEILFSDNNFKKFDKTKYNNYKLRSFMFNQFE